MAANSCRMCPGHGAWAPGGYRDGNDTLGLCTNVRAEQNVACLNYVTGVVDGLTTDETAICIPTGRLPQTTAPRLEGVPANANTDTDEVGYVVRFAGD